MPKQTVEPVLPATLEEKIELMVAEILTVNDDTEVTQNAYIVEDLHADSLDVVELVMQIEEDFNIEINDDDIDRFKKVGDYVTYLRERGFK